MPVNYSYDFVEVLLFQSPQAPTNPVPIKVALPECHAHICESNGEGGTTRHRLKLAAAGICSMADGISALAGSACWLPRKKHRQEHTKIKKGMSLVFISTIMMPAAKKMRT